MKGDWNSGPCAPLEERGSLAPERSSSRPACEGAADTAGVLSCFADASLAKQGALDQAAVRIAAVPSKATIIRFWFIYFHTQSRRHHIGQGHVGQPILALLSIKKSDLSTGFS